MKLFRPNIVPVPLQEKNLGESVLRLRMWNFNGSAILTQIILPQSIPVVATVAMLHFFYIWNESRITGLYQGTNLNYWQLSARLANPMPTPGVNPEPTMQSRALLLMGVPALVLLAFQRFFMQDMAVTGMEK